MTSLRRALWSLAAAGAVFGLIDVALILTSDYLPAPGLWVSLGLLTGWGFIGAGLVAWARRPDNRVGMLMTATGFAWLLSLVGTSDLPVLFTFGNALSSVYFAAALHLLLALPDGRLHERWQRLMVAVGYFVSTVLVVPLLLFADPESAFDCDECPDNVLLVEDNEGVVEAGSLVLNAFGLVAVVVVLVTLIRRWRAAAGAERRLYAPVYAAGIALMLAIMAGLALQSATRNSDATTVAWIVAMLPLALMPYLFLAALVRSRVLQGGAVGELIARLGEAPRPGGLREALSSALEDPTLELVYWLPWEDQFVDAAGRPYALPEGDPARAVAKVEREGECVAAIVFDSSLQIARDHVRSVGAAAALALENERLEAELRAKLGELRASRERMLSIGLDERRRLERDLHDGAQQRLVAMAINLRLARARLREDPDAADALLSGAGDELESALAELRELARGIHPAVLSDRGLGTALETLARRAPMPVEVSQVPEERLPEAVELAAYFVVAEALTNVAKYSQASHAKVDVARENGRVVVAVADDGVGGADPAGGTGLRGLADRIGVLEGRLEVDSRPGAGTTITARIPYR